MLTEIMPSHPASLAQEQHLSQHRKTHRTPNAIDSNASSLEGVARLVRIALETLDSDSAAAKGFLRGALHFIKSASFCDPKEPSKLEKGHLPLWQIRRVLKHVELNLPRKVAIEDLASVLNLSPSHFCRSFKRTMGVTPGAYVQYRRIELAQQLLMDSDQSLADIAIACGMCDQAHLNRIFRDLVGQTPGKWRRVNRDARVPCSLGLPHLSPAAGMTA